MPVPPRRSRQQRRQQQAGVEFKQTPRLSQQQAEMRGPKASYWWFAAGSLHDDYSQAIFKLKNPDLGVYFFLLPGAAADTPCHIHKHLLKSLGHLRVERKPVVHQGFRRELVQISHHLFLDLLHHRRLHRPHIRKSEKFTCLERCAVHNDCYFHFSTLLSRFRHAPAHDECATVSPVWTARRKRPERRQPLWVVKGSTKALDGERLWIGERLFARHHFRQQTSGGRAERQAVVLVAKTKPTPLMAA